ncbi:hypothetical protein PISMIDRAFT_672000 [Pisolithus microcarpus 441]|uniref:Uncharacterized protein n=1 Tax=Pisolithus microcarpus 441 TaxID=765257 RepID=A0A0C9ZKW3_9AGAM|nr:hypothetical protein PISMIDRAFT_672000 [Pisolithus microcarpus 441]
MAEKINRTNKPKMRDKMRLLSPQSTLSDSHWKVFGLDALGQARKSSALSFGEGKHHAYSRCNSAPPGG